LIASGYKPAAATQQQQQQRSSELFSYVHILAVDTHMAIIIGTLTQLAKK
jgi:hypothetical protein